MRSQPKELIVIKSWLFQILFDWHSTWKMSYLYNREIRLMKIGKLNNVFSILKIVFTPRLQFGKCHQMAEFRMILLLLVDTMLTVKWFMLVEQFTMAILFQAKYWCNLLKDNIKQVFLDLGRTKSQDMLCLTWW